MFIHPSALPRSGCALGAREGVGRVRAARNPAAAFPRTASPRPARRMPSGSWYAGAMATTIWAVLAALPAVAADAGAAGSATAGSATAGPATDLQKGEQFYGKVCGRCHETGIGPVLKGRGMPDMFYIAIARNGMKAMPAFRVTDVDDETLAAVAAYLSKSAAPAAERKP